jgi:glycosyltransferase involved in cell wall biosynthesis
MNLVKVRKPRLLFVGAFPPKDSKIIGGNVSDCRALMNSSFPQLLELDLIDTTQVSNPPPPIYIRAFHAARRLCIFILRILFRRPDATLLFVAVGLSVLEKGFMGWCSRIFGVPAYMFPRGGPLIDICAKSPFARIWVKFAFGGASKVLCQGATWQQFSMDVLGFSIENSIVIPNWTATPTLLDVGRQRNWYEKSKRLKFLFLGWVEREKGVCDLISACHILSERHNFQLDIAGDGNFLEYVREMISDYNLQNHVNLLGWLDEDRTLQLLKDSDVLVLPSYAEGLPNAMVEAMAAGLAVIVTAVGNIPDYIRSYENGILIEPGDSVALAEVMIRLICDPPLVTRLGKAAHASACEVFSIDSAVDQLVELVSSSSPQI